MGISIRLWSAFITLDHLGFWAGIGRREVAYTFGHGWSVD